MDEMTKMIMNHESKCRPTKAEFLEMSKEEKRLFLYQIHTQDVLKWVKIASICFVVSCIISVTIFVLYFLYILLK